MISKLAGSTTDKSQEKKIQALDFAEAMKELYFSQLKHLKLQNKFLRLQAAHSKILELFQL